MYEATQAEWNRLRLFMEYHYRDTGHPIEPERVWYDIRRSNRKVSKELSWVTVDHIEAAAKCYMFELKKGKS